MLDGARTGDVGAPPLCRPGEADPSLGLAPALGLVLMVMGGCATALTEAAGF
jgi:hypothetical protein